jgi:hypothetical protein
MNTRMKYRVWSMEDVKQSLSWGSRHTPYAIRGTRGERGFTLLLAVLIAAIVLALATSIFQIARKEITLSSLGRDSQFAFYAADTGAECALYWDVRYGYFATSSPSITPFCDGDTTLGATGHSATLPYTVSFEFEPNGICSRVYVTKSEASPHTVIHADGFSTNCATIATNPRALQRSVELRY